MQGHYFLFTAPLRVYNDLVLFGKTVFEGHLVWNVLKTITLTFSRLEQNTVSQFAAGL